MSEMNAANAPNPTLIFSMLGAHARTSALQTAIELDLFGALGEGPSDAATVAARCSASERGIRVLCDYLTVEGLVSKSGEVYGLTPTSAVFLDPASPACMASVARFLGNAEMMETYGKLTSIVREGRTSLPGEGTVEPENPVWVDFAESMEPMMRGAAGPLAEIALAGKTGPVSVLDIAASHGLFGITAARMNPEARITALDWASVLEVTRRKATAAGVVDRFTFVPGDAFKADLGGPHDVVLLTNILHHFDRATCVTLLQRMHAALRPGGRVALLEFVPNDDRVSPPVPAQFAMTMLISTVAGMAYTAREYASMLEEAGFRDVQAHPLTMSPETVVTAEA